MPTEKDTAWFGGSWFWIIIIIVFMFFFFVPGFIVEEPKA